MILQALKGYYDRLSAASPDEIAPYGFSEQKISFEVVLRPDGTIADINDLRVQQGKKLVPRVLQVPMPPKRSGRTPPPAFLWDKTAYIFGVDSDDAGALVENIPYGTEFRRYHEELLKNAEDIGLSAFLTFLRSWQRAGYPALRNYQEMLGTNVVFRLDGERCYLHQRKVALTIWSAALCIEDAELSDCLVTGLSGPVARLHPSIKGVQGGQPAGASIVSFQLDASKSYGKEQGANAPVSEAATFAYTTALNSMLSRTSGRDARDRPIYKNRVQIGDATTVFWAESDNASEASTSEDLMAALFNPPGESQDDDSSATTKLRNIVKAMADGRPIEQAAPDLAKDTRFYVLGLSPNAARISVRFWHDTTFGDLASAFQQHWADLRIEPVPWRTAPAIWQLLVETAALRKSSNVQPRLAGEVMRSILTNRPYPRTLWTGIITRIRADGTINGLRAAVIKACLIREGESVPMSLDRNNASQGYRLGRLFAVLEAAQFAGLGKLNANIRDKYISSASATPGRVFPLLLRGSENHLSSARKKGKGGRAYRLELERLEIAGGIDASVPFPTMLSLADQGLFFVGYYHQQAELKIARQKDETIDAEAELNSTDTTE